MKAGFASWPSGPIAFASRSFVSVFHALFLPLASTRTPREHLAQTFAILAAIASISLAVHIHKHTQVRVSLFGKARRWLATDSHLAFGAPMSRC